MTMLDATQTTDEVTWTVLVRNFGARTATDGQEPYLHERVTAAELVLDAGTLVFRATGGELVKSYGPSGWLEVSRA